MLVRNLRRAGDYQRAVMSQDENLRMAIANDRNVDQARKQLKMGMVPELTEQQKRSKEEQLTDNISNEAKAIENLLTMYPKEKVTEFLNELNDEGTMYLNVYWKEIKPLLENKTGLNARYFKRIVENHIKGITNSRGMSTVPSSGTASVSLNEYKEAKDAGIFMLRDTNYLRKIISKLRTLKTPAANVTANNLSTLKRYLPTDKLIKEYDGYSEDGRQRLYELMLRSLRFEADERLWQDAADEPSAQEVYDRVITLFSPLTQNDMEDLERLYEPPSP